MEGWNVVSVRFGRGCE